MALGGQAFSAHASPSSPSLLSSPHRRLDLSSSIHPFPGIFSRTPWRRDRFPRLSVHFLHSAFNLRGDILSVMLWLMGQNPVCFAHHSILYTSRPRQMLWKHRLCDENPRTRRWGCEGVAWSAERPWPPGIAAARKTWKQKGFASEMQMWLCGKLFVGARDNSEPRSSLRPARGPSRRRRRSATPVLEPPERFRQADLRADLR